MRQLRQLRSSLLQSSLLQRNAQQPASLLPAACRAISTSPATCGLEEFFDTPGKDNAPPTAGGGLQLF